MASNYPADMPLADYFADVYRPLKMLGKSAHTIRLYLQTLARFKDFLGREPTLEDLNDAAVCNFLQHRITQGRAAHTVDKERDKIIALANYAAKKRHIGEFIDIPTLNPPSAAPQCWKQEHVSALLAACEKMTGTVAGNDARHWWTAFHYVVLYTGERTGAVMSLKWEWLDMATGWLRVPGEFRKGGKKAMTYRLPQCVLDKLRLIELPKRDLIFAVHWKKSYMTGSFYLHYGKLLRIAGLPDSRKFKPQCLRRTFASFLEAAGGDATRALAHSSRKVTETSYLDETVIDRIPSSEVLGKVLQLPGFVARTV